jgi:NitT/TauT family transport system ATP-binding protein
MSTPGTDPALPAILRAADPDSPALAVRVRSASKTYPNGLRALEPVDLDVREREFITLLGPSGCGKSTFLRMLGGLSPPTTGSVVLWPGDRLERPGGTPGDATRRYAAQGDEARRRLSFVFQSPTLMPWASVARNVRLPLDLTGEAQDAQEPVRAALELVGLQDSTDLLPRELSGGMQMRVSIARALVTAPRLLLMDEPFGALDEITRSRLDREIRDLWARRSLTILFVTHSIYEAVFLSNRVLIMSARPGRISGEVMIDEPHPRTDAFRSSERFARWCTQLSDLLAGASDEPAARGGRLPAGKEAANRDDGPSSRGAR